jgi:hypothetical protein
MKRKCEVFWLHTRILDMPVENSGRLLLVEELKVLALQGTEIIGPAESRENWFCREYKLF